jgi:hypothetical protein
MPAEALEGRHSFDNVTFKALYPPRACFWGTAASQNHSPEPENSWSVNYDRLAGHGNDPS